MKKKVTKNKSFNSEHSRQFINFNSEHSRQFIKMIIRERIKAQDTRKAMDNKIGKRADGKSQNIDERILNPQHIIELNAFSKEARNLEKTAEKILKKELKKFPIYNKWLKDVKGVGTITAAAIVSYFDIEKADTVSKMTQYAGLNPAMIKGKKSIVKSKYKKSMGKIVSELPPNKNGEKRLCIQTNDEIRGDRATAGYILPYNKQLRVILCGILGSAFIKSNSPYRTNFYDPYKYRLEHSQKITKETKKGGKIVEIPWCECTKNHRHMAAIRFMIKGFLKDLYNEWRTIEGLPARIPYEEEYLGKVHSTPKKLKKTVNKQISLAAKSKSKLRMQL